MLHILTSNRLVGELLSVFYLFRNSSEGVLQTVGFSRGRFLKMVQSLASQTAPGTKWCSAGEDGVTALVHHRQAASRRRNFTTHVSMKQLFHTNKIVITQRPQMQDSQGNRTEPTSHRLTTHSIQTHQ